MRVALQPPRYRGAHALTEAERLLAYALTICQYGERAPGGNETWAEFGNRAEDFLRRRGCELRGYHTPDEPACPDCRARAV